MSKNIENEFIEFKESLSQLSRAAESIVAMLNKHSKAQVLFGIKDNGDVVGVTLGNKTLKDICDFLIHKIKPAIIPIITEELTNEKIIIRVSVTGHNKPYSADGKYLIRSGSENKKIDPEIMKELLFSSSIESMTEIESFEQELSFNQLKQLYIRFPKLSTAQAILFFLELFSPYRYISLKTIPYNRMPQYAYNECSLQHHAHREWHIWKNKSHPDNY